MIKCTTETGSQWFIDDGRKRWFRPVNADSPYVRSTQGEFASHSPISIGENILFIGRGFDNPADIRMTQTTKVQSITEINHIIVAAVYHQENTPIMTRALVLESKPDAILVACIGGEKGCRETHWAFPSAVVFDIE